MEQQNQLLRRQLSISQNQLIQAWGGDGEEGGERAKDDTANGEHSQPPARCKDKVCDLLSIDKLLDSYSKV